MSENRTTFKVSPLLKKKMEEFPNIDWEKFTQSAIERKLADLEKPVPILDGNCQIIHWLSWNDF